MKFPIKQEILLDEKNVFYVSYLNLVYFDGDLLTHLPYDTNLEKLTKSINGDTKLKELVQNYNVTSQHTKELDTKQKMLENMIEDALLKTKIYSYGILSSKNDCGIRKEEKYSGVDYYAENFWLETSMRKYNFGCYTKEMNDAINQIDPITKVHIFHSKDIISISIDGSVVYLTNRFTLKTVLSLFKELKLNGNLNEFLDTLHELKEIHDRKAEKVGLFFEIAHRIQELAENSKS